MTAGAYKKKYNRRIGKNVMGKCRGSFPLQRGDMGKDGVWKDTEDTQMLHLHRN